MKHINFINALSPDEQKKIALWYRTTLLIFTGMLLSATIIHIWQIHRIFQLRSLYHSLVQNTPKYEKNSQEYAQTTQKYEQVIQYCRECTIINEELERCIQGLSIPEAIHIHPEVTLSHWQWTNQSFSAMIQSANITQSIHCIHMLEKLPIIKTITIFSFQSHENKKDEHTGILHFKGTTTLAQPANTQS